jgi:hypothetical protein
MKCYSVIKDNKLLVNAIKIYWWVNTGRHRFILCGSIYMKICLIYSDRKWINDCLQLRVGPSWLGYRARELRGCFYINCVDSYTDYIHVCVSTFQFIKWRAYLGWIGWCINCTSINLTLKRGAWSSACSSGEDQWEEDWWSPSNGGHWWS